MRHILIPVGVAIAVFTGFEVAADISALVSAGAGLFSGAAVAMVLALRNRAEKLAAAARAAAMERKEVAQVRIANEQLILAYEELLFSGKAPDAVPVFKKLIETVRPLIVRVAGFSEFSDARHVVMSFAETHLPSAVKLFLQLNDQDRTKQLPTFIAQLEGYIMRLESAVFSEDQTASDLGVQLGFMDARLGQN